MNVSEVADALIDARRRNEVLEGFPGGVPVDLATAERIQEAVIGRWFDDRPYGWKIGAIAPRFAPPAGANRVIGPALAVLDATGDTPSVVVPASCLVEAELAVRFQTLPATDPAGWTADDLMATEHEVLLALEICGSAVPDINDLGPTAITADLGNNVAVVCGPVTDLRLGDLGAIGVTLQLDGETVGEGGTWTVPGGVADGIVQLARLLAGRGRALSPGDVVCTGSLAGAPPGRPGQRVTGRFAGLGEVSCSLS